MLGTIINAVAMASALKAQGVDSVVFSAFSQVKDTTVTYNAEEAMANEDNFPYSSYDDKGQLQPEGACVIMEAETGYVSALVGGREHLTSLQFNRATQALRQPGSAFKPIAVYGPALEYLNWGTGNVVVDEPVTYGSWSPSNSGGGYSGPVTIRYAIQNSINIAAVKTLEEVGVENGLTFAESLGISTLDEENDCGLALALGGIYNGVSVLEMTAAYGAYANEGAYCKPLLYTKVTSSKLEIDDEYAPEENQVMKKTTAYLMTSMLESVVSSGTGTAAYIGRPMAGKTGTTDEGKDIWFCGYTPDYVGAVWIGYDEPTAMYNSYGSMYPTVVWKEIMSQVHEDLPVRDFENPGGIVSANICTQTGKLATQHCGSVSNELYVSGYAPKEYCNGSSSNVKLVKICKESGLLATKYCPETEEISEYSDNVPTETCHIHAQAETTVSVCTESGLLATDYCPSTIEMSSYDPDLPNGSCTIHTANNYHLVLVSFVNYIFFIYLIFC